jgi:hypothetical protein
LMLKPTSKESSAGLRCFTTQILKSSSPTSND